MSASVISDGRIPLPPSQKNFISHLDSLADLALSGELTGVFSIWVEKGGEIKTRWTGFANNLELLGALDTGVMITKQNVLSRMIGEGKK